MFRAHPFIFLALLGVFVLFGMEVAFGIENVVEAGTIAPEIVPLISNIGLIGFAASAFAFFTWWTSTYFTHLDVTWTHVRRRAGIITNRSSQLRHSDIKNIQVNQGPIQYVFGTGTLELSSAGQAAEEIIMTDIPNPEDVRQRLSNQRAEAVQ
jgi:Bacterial membrane flanked domain.